MEEEEEEEEEEREEEGGVVTINIRDPGSAVVASTAYPAPASPPEWKEGRAIREFPTNAFGKLEFAGSLSLGSLYARVADTVEAGAVQELLTQHWQLTSPRPRLALSIIGGAKNFKAVFRNINFAS